jgi:hypothetical protein
VFGPALTSEVEQQEEAAIVPSEADRKVMLPEQLFANSSQVDKEGEAFKLLVIVQERIVNPVDEHVEPVVNDVTESGVLRSGSATSLRTTAQGAKRKATAVEADKVEEAALPPTKKARSTAREGAEREPTKVETHDEAIPPAFDMGPFNPDVTFGDVEQEEMMKDARGVDTNAMLSEKLVDDPRPDEEVREASQQVYMELNLPEEPIVDAVVDPIDTIVGDVAESRALRSPALTKYHYRTTRRQTEGNHAGG